MNIERHHPWILVGYELFANEGPRGLKVEVIARKVGKSKSSFYHHFADLEVFTGHLLAHHLNRAAIIAGQERACKTVVPDLVNVLLAAKTDLLFNRQLRINRQVVAYKRCFEQAGKDVSQDVLGIWSEMLGLPDKSSLARMVLLLSLDNFYLQLTDETMTYDWLVCFINDLKDMVRTIQVSEFKTSSFVR